MTVPSFHHLSFILFYFSASVLSSHPVLDIPLSKINAPKPSFTITEVLDLNGLATLMPMPNAPTTTPLDPLPASPPPPPHPSAAGEIAKNPLTKPLNAGEIAQTPNPKNQALQSLKTSSSPTFLNDASFKDAFLNATTTLRNLHSAPPLSWNDTLATYASNYSSRCRALSSRSPFGETVASNKENVSAVVESWARLRPQKLNMTNLVALETSLGAKKVAKALRREKAFTQLVWKNSTQIGCGRTLCGGQNGVQGWLVVCEFDPKGNVAGEYGANVQVSSSSGGGGGGAASAVGQISAGKTRPNAGAIGEARNGARGTVDRVQVWSVFLVVCLVLGAVFS